MVEEKSGRPQEKPPKGGAPEAVMERLAALEERVDNLEQSVAAAANGMFTTVRREPVMFTGARGKVRSARPGSRSAVIREG